MYTTYIIFNQKIKRYYTGHTEDFKRRIFEHNSGQNKSTRSGSPWEAVYVTEFETRREAMRLEERIKKRGAKRFLLDVSML